MNVQSSIMLLFQTVNNLNAHKQENKLTNYIHTSSHTAVNNKHNKGFLKPLLCAKDYTKHFTCTNSFNSHNSPKKYML